MNPLMGVLFVFYIFFITAFIWFDRIQLKKGKTKKSIFFIHPIYRLRISLWVMALASLPIIALQFQGWEMFYFALLSAVAFTFFLLISGMFGSETKEQMKVTNFYSPGTLIFLAIFLSTLIGLVSWRLYVLAP